METNREPSYNWFVEQYRKKGYRSLTQFASKNGYQKSSLSRYFNRERELPADVLVKLSADLGVKPNQLLRSMGYEV